MPRAMSTVAASRIVGSGGGRVNPDVGTKSCAGKQNQANCYESRQRYECPTQCCLTPRSRRGPTSKRQARAVGWRIFHRAGLAFCCRSRLSSNVRHKRGRSLFHQSQRLRRELNCHETAGRR